MQGTVYNDKEDQARMIALLTVALFQGSDIEGYGLEDDMMFVSEFITDAPSAMPAEASVLPLEPIKVDEVVRRIAVGIVFTIGVGAVLTIAAAFAMRL